MEDTKNNDIESVAEILQCQIDAISSYITIENDDNDKSIEECRANIKKLDELTTNLVEYSHTQLENIRKRQDMYDEDKITLHAWTVNTQTQLDNMSTQLSLVSEKFGWYANSCKDVYRYKVGDHIITFAKKLNWFRILVIKLIFGSCEIL